MNDPALVPIAAGGTLAVITPGACKVLVARKPAR